MKRPLIIVAGVVVVLGIAVALYFIFFRSTPGVSVTPPGSATLPVANPTTPPPSGSSGRVEPTSSSPVTVSPRLVKISSGPVVPGMSVTDTRPVNASSSPDTLVRFVERQSGNVYSYLASSKTQTRTNNKTIPGIQSASWLPDGSFAFVRYLSGADFSTINTYALPASGTGGFFLNQNISDLSVSSTSVLTLASGVSGSVASLSKTDGTGSLPIFTTPLSSLRVSLAGKGQYLAYTKPSASLPGSAFIVDGAGRFSRVAGPLDGLIALPSPSGQWVLITYTQNSSLRMRLINTATDETMSLPVATLADKCVWAANDSALYCGVPVNPPLSSAYPDDWYQGALSFSDRLWKINVTGRYAELILDFEKETGTALDAESLAVNGTNSLLVFLDKNTGSLWGFSL